jgi:hypothetical protein
MNVDIREKQAIWLIENKKILPSLIVHHLILSKKQDVNIVLFIINLMVMIAKLI